ncbi:hypothetical protein KXX33_000298 [Aspergillus fumigatus]|jgi:hypothetical protein|nr:hypothetical protein CNMCM8714_004088 [Aspergillus fumigatus]KAF4273623.1 hypothetical protein CNMCM8812_007218 [Aspergillus fumigatus]KAH1278901.1 hypothetical protein KXX30_004005 [Aspergillus fumigatus]KAH1279691.1 hypothetical protein KXX45_006031 [Aspergillus fumigatus]KAH1292196.1 hypothetical protein KXX48_006511 [Aspergillus fumigatus]
MSAIFPKNAKQNLLSLPLRTPTSQQDPLLYIDRQTKYIQRSLQVLIDAQSDGLLAGLAGNPHTDSTSNQSSTPTELSRSKSPSTIPVRQPVARKIGLREAREGIFKSIYDLLKLKEEEREILSFRLDERSDALEQIARFRTKRAGLKDAISTIHDNEESYRSKELLEESHQLEAEIQELETRLLEMKARHRSVIRELAQMEDAMESKLSSYKASLSLVESDIEKFLKDPPVKPDSVTSSHSTFYSLNPKRRTLEMAHEHWTTEQDDLRKKQKEVDAEIQALEEGGGVWKQVVGEVSGFEKRLRSAMRRSIQAQSQLLETEGHSKTNTENDQVQSVVEDLEHTTNRVEQHLNLAEKKDWKLLICCIGAELEALREAREMLLDAFKASTEDKSPAPGRETTNARPPDGKSDSLTDPLGVDNPEPPADLLRDEEQRSPGPNFRSDNEDDEPDPAWLLPEA